LELVLYILDHQASTQEAKDHAEKLRAELEAHLTPAQREAVRVQVQARPFETAVAQLLRL
jgi:hypothetical protein